MWKTLRLENEDVTNLLARTENHFFDFKDKTDVAKCTKTASAFANADGGELVIGIRDAKESNRVSNLFSSQEDANGCISAICDIFKDGPEYLDIEFFQIKNGFCLHLTIQKTPYLVKSSDNRVFKRQNAQDREQKASDITKLELEKGVRSFEDSKVEAVPSEIARNKIIEDFLKHAVPHSSLDDMLKRERLLVDDHLRACALLLFDENPQSLLPQSAVKLYRYRTLASEGDRQDLVGQPESIEGPIYSQIYDAVRRTKEMVEQIPKLGDSGLTSIKYPEEAIHEVICNAVLHRDYSISDNVHIRVFDNRIEVESPGKLAGTVTVTNILKQRFARNKKIV